MKLKFLSIIVTIAISLTIQAQTHPKREFRGAWIPTVTSLYKGMSTEDMKQRLINELDILQKAGINAVLFQVRPEADAMYESLYEPWSRYLTGEQGKQPYPYWDPMAFMIEECHNRFMEFHAWINPYRVKANIKNDLAPGHLYYEYPERFIEYDNKLFFDPALQENRDHICKVVADMVTRYDLDAIHMDDYFYPYPAAGKEYPDDESYRRFGALFSDKGDWRRSNVNMLIKQLHETIRGVKPWVKFGISPFGVYRNQSSDPLGSNTRALQNYDDLYADVLLWAKEGWIDYNIPQIYWHVGHPTADYEILVNWWAKNTGNRPVFIGQSISNTIKNADPENENINQLPRKMALQRSFQTIGGSCQWPANDIITNQGKYQDALVQEYHRYPALIPVFDFMDNKPPAKVKKLKKVQTGDGQMLFWTPPKATDEMDVAVQYVVYRFENKEKVDIGDPSKIIAFTRNNYISLPVYDGKTKYNYVVTALDRLHNESKSVGKKVKL